MWYALVQDEQLGPMPDSELVELYLKGVVADQTLVWNANLPDWKPFSEVPDLMELAGGEELEAEEEGDGATIMMADDANWAALLAQATEIAMDQVAIIPTHFQVNTWGTRADLQYEPRTDEYTLATGISR